jgi:hypothetical protein
MTRAEPTEDTFVLPADLDPVHDVEEHLADGWTHEVEVRVATSIDVAARWIPRTLGRLHPVDDEHCVLRGSTDDPDWYAAQLAATHVPFHVVGSEEVRTAVRTLAARLAKAAE